MGSAIRPLLAEGRLSDVYPERRWTQGSLLGIPAFPAHSEAAVCSRNHGLRRLSEHLFTFGRSLAALTRELDDAAGFWTYDIARRSIRQISRSSVASLSASPVPASEVVHYKAKDGRLISALLWVPFNLRRDASNPAVVVPHGGPTSQMQDEWNPIIAALVSRGYVCIAPNVRGSTGYGMEFQRANFQDLGGGDLQDEVSAATFLVETGYVNSKRIGITGGSYGGYMTLMAVSRTPDVWAAGVEEYGIVNWLTMLEHEDPFLQQYEKSLLGDPVKDRAAYDAASPITYLHDTHAPLLILQGDNDPRVPKEEALQVFDLLRQDGKTVEAHFYPNEGHGFAQRDNRIDALSRMVAWFDRYLKN